LLKELFLPLKGSDGLQAGAVKAADLVKAAE
jgi:hypothetical protein